MFVAMPTAIPPPPLTRRLGNLAGSTTRLDGVAVVRGREVDGVLVDLPQQLHRQRGEPRLGVVVDEAGGEEGVVVGVDPDREHGLHAGIGDRRRRWRSTNRSTTSGAMTCFTSTDGMCDRISWPRRSQSAVRSKLCFSSHFLSAPRAPLSARTYSARNGMRSTSFVESAPGRASRICSSFSCLAPQNPTSTCEQVGVSAVADHELDLTVRVLGPARDHAELQQQVLHVARELLAARGVGDLHGVLAEVRHAAVTLEEGLEERLFHVESRVPDEVGNVLVGALCSGQRSKRTPRPPTRVLDIELVQRLARGQGPTS